VTSLRCTCPSKEKEAIGRKVHTGGNGKEREPVLVQAGTCFTESQETDRAQERTPVCRSVPGWAAMAPRPAPCPPRPQPPLFSVHRLSRSPARPHRRTLGIWHGYPWRGKATYRICFTSRPRVRNGQPTQLDSTPLSVRFASPAAATHQPRRQRQERRRCITTNVVSSARGVTNATASGRDQLVRASPCGM
jgi:negative regulator of sigma E activity